MNAKPLLLTLTIAWGLPGFKSDSRCAQPVQPAAAASSGVTEVGAAQHCCLARWALFREEVAWLKLIRRMNREY